MFDAESAFAANIRRNRAAARRMELGKPGPDRAVAQAVDFA